MKKLKKIIGTDVTLSFWIALIAVLLIVILALVFFNKY